ncbi:MAG: hypothetical protein KKB30_17165 [Proteobacteria bacterium]|nr:hypothetical protein [Pseudomonadota bacterium]MBU1739880.1 hypothetical protein [Pseudomonadota bacterium]MBU1858210.1 hypothetical protein [Verrucomicrobiota bacterium]
MSQPVSNSKVVSAKAKETTNGRVDSPELQEKIVALANALEASDNACFSTGEICDEIVALVGIQYGEHTFQTIAQRPEIQCNPRYLRRCWQYYRLVTHKECKSPELDTLIRTKPRGVQELARVMDTDLTDEDKVQLVKALASEAVLKNLTVDAIASRVTNELKRHNMLRRKPPEKKASHKSNSQANGIPAVVDDGMLKQYAECIRAYGKSGEITSIKDQMAVKELLVATIDKVEQQAEQLKTDGEYADSLFKQIQRLERIRCSLLAKDPSDIAQIEEQVA